MSGPFVEIAEVHQHGRSVGRRHVRREGHPSTDRLRRLAGQRTGKDARALRRPIGHHGLGSVGQGGTTSTASSPTWMVGRLRGTRQAALRGAPRFSALRCHSPAPSAVGRNLPAPSSDLVVLPGSCCHVTPDPPIPDASLCSGQLHTPIDPPESEGPAAFGSVVQPRLEAACDLAVSLDRDQVDAVERPRDPDLLNEIAGDPHASGRSPARRLRLSPGEQPAQECQRKVAGHRGAGDHHDPGVHRAGESSYARHSSSLSMSKQTWANTKSASLL